jgi:hypothetical protein
MCITTDAVKKELDGLLNAGSGACGSLQIAGASTLSAIGLTKKLLLCLDWWRTGSSILLGVVPELHSHWLRPTTLS